MAVYTESPSPDTIVRVLKRENPYVMIERATVQDKRLSWEARGLLVYLLSLPADWDIRVSHLQTEGDAGRDALRAILRELQECGYVSGVGRESQERGKRGRFGQADVRVYESPKLNPHHSDASPPSPENPATANPSTDSPSPVKASPYIIENLERKDSTKNTHTTPRASASPPTPPPNGNRVCVSSSSAFSPEQRREYALAHPLSIQTPDRWLWSKRTAAGEFDDAIRHWIATGKPIEGSAATAKPADMSACPDCHGSGSVFGNPSDPKTHRRCTHPLLCRDTTAAAQPRGPRRLDLGSVADMGAA
jgi:hypothetical protein